jgi:hypothetical protein
VPDAAAPRTAFRAIEEATMSAPIDTWDDMPDPGETFTLTPEGWQRVDFVEPEEGWRIRGDGSYESPDGSIRTWPLDPPVPA